MNKNIVNFGKYRTKNEIKKMIDHVRLLELKKVIPSNQVERLISKIVSGGFNKK